MSARHPVQGVAAFLFALVLALPCVGLAAIPDSVPDETLKALNLDRNATPRSLYDALTTRYRSEADGAGKGNFASFWEPIPMSKYLAPSLFYEAPTTLDMVVKAEDCVACHTAITGGHVLAWQKSLHSDLKALRELPDTDTRSYKKAHLAEVESNLQSLGILQAGQQLDQVGCIDCHMNVGAKEGHHIKDLRLPDAAACGTCHLRQYAERESERDTLTWPQDQWPAGRPSHALDYKANVETATWAAMQQREVAEGCTMCHTNQNKCDNCHGRHEFSPVEARKPEACSTCHNGVDHNEFEAFMYSRHGVNYQTRGDTWDWHAPLSQALEKGQTAPTCAFCHMEYKGQFTHNVVRKVRWGFLPTKNIADNLGHEWFTDRREAWKGTCSTCHSPSFADAYLDMMDKGIISGMEVIEEMRPVVQALFDERLLVGQKTNRPALPEPEKDEAGGFFSLLMSNGNNPTMVDRVFAEMWEQHVAKHYKGLAHVNPGGFTYTEGWSQLMKGKTFILEENTRLREKAAMEKRLEALEGKTPAKAALHGDPQADTVLQRVTSVVGGGGLAALGGLLALSGMGLLWRRRKPEATGRH
ncbi:MAG: hydroxylamine reductase [Gemmatimonadales bacterium]|nr:hydroxylamine reductase [Gemmatimonadales bacterium]